METMRVPILAQGGYGHMDGGWPMMHNGYGGLIMWILIIVGVVLVVFLTASLFRSGGGESKPRDSALEILKQRYARGEISREEFERMKEDLNR